MPFWPLGVGCAGRGEGRRLEAETIRVLCRRGARDWPSWCPTAPCYLLPRGISNGRFQGVARGVGWAGRPQRSQRRGGGCLGALDCSLGVQDALQELCVASLTPPSPLQERTWVGALILPS